MPNIEKALRRDRKEKNRRKMGRDGDSVFLIQEIQRKRHAQLRRKQRRVKEERRGG